MNAQLDSDHDPYRNVAGLYDRLFESMNRGLRMVGIRMFRPVEGMKVLDVGCGTGAHLELYRRFGCDLYGLDRSASMLAVARKRLGNAATLDLGDAADMPYEDGTFDLVIAMLSLHEMPTETRSAVLSEIGRVLNNAGHMLLIDFQPGRVQLFQGWVSKIIISLSEFAAGREHFRNYRDFMTGGGLSALAAQHELRVEKQRVLAGGTFAACLVSPGP